MSDDRFREGWDKGVAWQREETRNGRIAAAVVGIPTALVFGWLLGNGARFQTNYVAAAMEWTGPRVVRALFPPPKPAPEPPPVEHRAPLNTELEWELWRALVERDAEAKTCAARMRAVIIRSNPNQEGETK